MIKQLVCATVLLLGATVLRADVFSFSYSGMGVSLTGTVTATETLPGMYTVTDIVGTRTGSGHTWAISDLPGGSFLYSDSWGSMGTFLLGLSGFSSGTDTLQFLGGLSVESGSAGASIGSFYLGSSVPVPEPATLLLLCTMGLGVWVLARKLPAKQTSSR